MGGKLIPPIFQPNFLFISSLILFSDSFTLVFMYMLIPKTLPQNIRVCPKYINTESAIM